jgi:flagellar motor component MotA
MIALEKEKPKDPFSAKALQYLSDGFNEENIEYMLKKDIRLTIPHHNIGQSVFRGMGSSAPAFGMIGTLIGLVQMLFFLRWIEKKYKVVSGSLANAFGIQKKSPVFDSPKDQKIIAKEFDQAVITKRIKERLVKPIFI